MRFSIRELFMLTLIVALVLGWFCHWRVLDRRQEKRGEYIERLKDMLRRTTYQKDYLAHILKREGRGFIFPNRSSPLPPDLENEPD